MSNDEIDDNIVPEFGVATTGAPRLDADPVDASFLDAFDKLDDEAEAIEAAELAANPPAPVAVETPSEDENFLNDGLEGTPVVTEAAVDPVAEVAPVVETQPENPLDPEIAAIEQPRNLSESNQSNWKKLQETASRYKQEAMEAATLKQRLEQMQQPQVQTPQDYEELKKFKQIFDLKNDPEFHTKFEEPIKGATENIYSILKKNGASEETIASIQKVGGPDKVSESWWKQNVLDKISMTDSEKLKRNLVDVVDLKEKQEHEIAHTAQYAEQILEERKTQNVRWFQNENQVAYNEIDQITKDTSWARFQEVPQNASPEQIDEIQKHNASVQDLAAKFNHALWPQTATDRARVAAAAVLSHKLVEQLKIEQTARTEMTTRLQQIEQENSRLKQAGRAPKASANSVSSKINVSNNDRWKMNSGDAIDLGLDEAGL